MLSSVIVLFSWGGTLVNGDCSQQYHERRISKVYEDPMDFEDLKSTLEYLDKLNVMLGIVSVNEAEIIRDWSMRRGFDHFFFSIMGMEDGPKEVQIQKLAHEFPDKTIVFVSASVGDMGIGQSLGNLRRVGLTADYGRKPNKKRYRNFQYKGAGYVVVVDRLLQLVDLIGDII